MKQNFWLPIVLASAVLTISGPASAHHGTAAFDKQTSVVFAGQVTRFDFSNPHVVVAINVKNADGKFVEWRGELTSPNNLIRAGWTRNTLKPGDQVTISGYPAKSGEYTMWVQKISKDGQELPVVVGDN